MSDICGESRFLAILRAIVNFLWQGLACQTSVAKAAFRLFKGLCEFSYGKNRRIRHRQKKEMSVTYDIHLLAYPKCVIITN